MKDLKSGIEHLKQAKAHMSKANGIMSDHISKLRELEKENAGLRAKLEALIQSDDSYMKLPLDADGEPIRLGDTVWYTGIDVDIEKDCPMKVNGFVRVPFTLETFIETLECPRKAIATESLTHKRPESPDSWEKLEEDASVGAQDYCANRLGVDIRKTLTSDDDRAFAEDIIRRAKKLAGIEEAQR